MMMWTGKALREVVACIQLILWRKEDVVSPCCLRCKPPCSPRLGGLPPLGGQPSVRPGGMQTNPKPTSMTARPCGMWQALKLHTGGPIAVLYRARLPCSRFSFGTEGTYKRGHRL